MGIYGLQKLQPGRVGNAAGPGAAEKHSPDQPAFSEVLKSGFAAGGQGLNFSKHAAKRMDERGIAVDNQLMDHLQQAVEGARKKGARDVAVIGSQGVFIVNVPNNVIVTTMSADDMKDRIFTNIDSAVIM